MKTFTERLLDILLSEGTLTQDKYSEVIEVQKKTSARLVKVLSEGFVNQIDLALAMSKALDIPMVNIPRIRIAEHISDLIPKDICKKSKLLPLYRLGDKLFVAMSDPMNVLAIDEVKSRTKMEVVPMLGVESQILEAISGATSATEAMDKVLKDAAELTDVEQVKETRTDDIDLDKSVTGEDAPVVKLVNLILVQALKEKASDIHIEPFEKHIKLRYRIDGNLIESTPPPKALQAPLISRIKILASLDIAERRLPQDGRFRIRVAGKEIDLRVSLMPTVFGEKVVIRILDKSALSGSIDQLGLDGDTLKRFRNAVDSPHGMILVTGPTGSGKTTTLYSVLQELNSPDYNIVTVEDPVEFQLPGVNQVPVKAEIGLTFGAALRAILRQDPDIVMIGEIRDNETADIAVKAALTGHQVLSTLHTNDAAGALARMSDMGIEPFLISSSVILICAQRLVRRICANCKEEYKPEAKLLERLELKPTGQVFYRGAGCDRCKKKGYLGRAAILEVLTMSDEIRKMIVKQESSNLIKQQAIKEGMKTLRHAGIDKALEGITSLEEVYRITSED